MLLAGVTTMSNLQSQTLTITFKGYTEVKGNLLFRVVDEDNKEVKAELAVVNKLNQTVQLSLPKGRYAISAFHDANGNKKLDKNMVGMPVEKYGFSNDARGTFGPPSLESQLFELNSDKNISITLK
jgi:uncharacterized protein (DUF2141 family)